MKDFLFKIKVLGWYRSGNATMLQKLIWWLEKYDNVLIDGQSYKKIPNKNWWEIARYKSCCHRVSVN